MTDLPGRSWWTLEFTFKHPLLPPIRAPFSKKGFCHFCSGKRIWFKDYSIFNHPLRTDQNEYRSCKVRQMRASNAIRVTLRHG